jgi:glycogen(starch) synthase
VPIDVLVVATWFPAYDDGAAGRFVADQAEALLATGLARPRVITYDQSRLSGGATTRGRQAAAVVDLGVARVRSAEPLFVAPAWGVDRRLPVARLSIPEGLTPAAGVVHAAMHREAVLRAVGDRLAGEAGGPGARGIVHAHTVYPDGAAAVALADRLGWPLVITEHASFVDRIVATPALRDRYAGALQRAHRLLAVSEMLAGELRSAFPEYASKIDVMPNGVPLDRFRAAPVGERVADQLVFVGYRKATKGIDVLLRAVAVARSRRPTITLRLLGRSPDEATEAGWRNLADGLGIADAVTFDDPVDRAGIAEALSRASVFVHPSPRETFGVVAVEALGSGLPVVATDSGGVSEILGQERERLGGIVPVGDHEALGAAILRTLDRRATFDPIELRASVERRFGAPVVAQRLLAVYREAVEAASSPEAPARPLTTLATGPRAHPDRTVVVALDREQAALRLAPLAEALRATLIVVTATEPAGAPLPRVGRLVEVAVDATWRPKTIQAVGGRGGVARRLGRLAADPAGTILRRLGRGAGSVASLKPASRAVAELMSALPASTRLLPVDGHDHLAVSAIVRADPARLSPGGLRRLADDWTPAVG